MFQFSFSIDLIKDAASKIFFFLHRGEVFAAKMNKQYLTSHNYESKKEMVSYEKLLSVVREV